MSYPACVASESERLGEAMPCVRVIQRPASHCRALFSSAVLDKKTNLKSSIRALPITSVATRTRSNSMLLRTSLWVRPRKYEQ